MSFKSDSKNKNVEVIFNIPDDLKIQSYPGTFNHVMTNLFSNVFFHAFDGQIEGAKIEVSASFKHNNVFISVKDNGCGISEDIQDKIFDPFFTTKRVQKNTGLGLYAVMNLVTQKLKGSISFESEEQTGTTFYLTLPNLQTEHEITQSDDIEPL
ncbi:HAMP domain-containing histidine kinase [Pseudoalteromonas sp. DY56-GL22]